MAAIDSLDQQIRSLALGVPVALRVSARARRLSLRVDAASRGVELVLPRRYSAQAALGFVAAHRGWIAARVAAMPPLLRLADGTTVPVFGTPHRIRHVADRAAAPVTIADGEIRVRGDPAHLPRRVRDHLIALARREFSARARALAARLGKSVTRVGVRDPKSRWGSCSSAGALSFSWNHSPRFWRVVSGLVPDIAAPRAWLKRHRNELMAYGA
jgi:predicted metal-dependent hydrolase